jgi:hypothetical protein
MKSDAEKLGNIMLSIIVFGIMLLSMGVALLTQDSFLKFLSMLTLLITSAFSTICIYKFFLTIK